MPYRSGRQRNLFHALLAEGRISGRVVAEWDRATKLAQARRTRRKPKGKAGGGYGGR